MGRSLQALLWFGAQLLLPLWAKPVTQRPITFYYQDLITGLSRTVDVNGVQLHIDSPQSTVSGQKDGEATLPCHFWFEPDVSHPKRVRIKWSKVSSAREPETDVLVAIGTHSRSYGDYSGRVHLSHGSEGDASLVISTLQLNDTGLYRCEVVGGLEDQSTSIHLELHGVVFPYQHPQGRYHLSFAGAQQACTEQDATLATFSQLYESWREGLHWCNAGWLADGTVQYPITRPRGNCGGPGVAPGVRSYGKRHRHQHQYDVFCFSSAFSGEVFYLQPARAMSLAQAQRACVEQGALIAKVGQLYSAWRFQGLDHCHAGWLADGSVRYAITKPRQNCGPLEPGVRSFGFPPPQHKYGVYCYKEHHGSL
ncbi:hyaluronan and proteoglycan link protein 3-like [Eucyclogobius newberryi]|uniref:hyaluronan and proteoglycan link protein 3-like n=1 Tax=Eucyclogobius newberryi TaxID=166745 RepID=UPI003B5BB070